MLYNWLVDKIRQQSPKKSIFAPILMGVFVLALLTSLLVKLSPKAPTNIPAKTPAISSAPTASPEIPPKNTPDANGSGFVKTAVLADGIPVAVLSSRQAAEELLADILRYYGDLPQEGTVSELVFSSEITLADSPDTPDGEVIYLDQAYAELIKENSPLKVKCVRQVIAIISLPYKNQTQKNPNIPAGSCIVVSLGREGIKNSVTQTEYQNGKLVITTKLDDVIILQAADASRIEGTLNISGEKMPGKNAGKRGKSKGELIFKSPVDKPKVSAYFGGSGGAMNYGINYQTAKDQPVKAACAGKVVTKMMRGNYGLMLELDHGNGFVTRYTNLAEVAVSIGDSVNTGDVIGKAGVSADGSSQLLHFELRIDSIAYNPFYYIS